jgi:hypothetical protein
MTALLMTAEREWNVHLLLRRITVEMLLLALPLHCFVAHSLLVLQ